MADPLIARVDAATERIIDFAQAQVRRAWRNLDDLSDQSGDSAVAEVVPAVTGAQNVVVALHAGYVNLITQLPLSAPLVATLIPEAAWNRSPLIRARTLVAGGYTLRDALHQSSLRAAQVHSGDILRARDNALTAMGDGLEGLRPLRWAKVPGPNACAWCREISTKLYYRPDGLPAHLNCRCAVLAVTPEDAGNYTNASTVFSNFRWRSRVQSSEIAEAQRRMGETAQRLYGQAMDSMLEAA